MRDCRFIVSGIVEVKLNDVLASSMNYGDGECDAIATLTKADGEIVEIDLSTCKRKENQFRKKR